MACHHKYTCLFESELKMDRNKHSQNILLRAEYCVIFCKAFSVWNHVSENKMK